MVHALVAEDYRHVVQLHKVARDGHGPALVTAVGAVGAELVPEQGVVVGPQVDERGGGARWCPFLIVEVLGHGSLGRGKVRYEGNAKEWESPIL